jgi:metal-sulfur cluster biosynthetic enzyme
MVGAVPEQNIVRAIRQVYDPDVPLNLYDMGLIYGIKIDGSRVHIVMTFTSPNCPMADYVLKELHEAVCDVPGVTEVKIEITFDPPWDKSRLSEEALLELGML